MVDHGEGRPGPRNTASTTERTKRTCGYRSAHITRGEFDRVLLKIEQDEAYSGYHDDVGRQDGLEPTPRKRDSAPSTLMSESDASGSTASV